MLQIGAGYLRLGALMRFVSRSVITGFVNALAILIFLAQRPQLHDVQWYVYAMVCAGLAIIYLLPRITKAVPSPLVCIIVLTALSMVLGLDLRTVGDMGSFPDELPVLAFPHVPLSLETLRIIFPYSASIAVVGLLELGDDHGIDQHLRQEVLLRPDRRADLASCTLNPSWQRLRFLLSLPDCRSGQTPPDGGSRSAGPSRYAAGRTADPGIPPRPRALVLP